MMSRKYVITTIIVLLVGTAVFSFIAIKANLASFTHDESYTYNFYVHNSFMDILSHKNSYTNNHLLNTLMMKYSEVLFGSSELTLRLPNLLMLLVFFVYFFLIVKRGNTILALSFFVIIFTNIALIDFFGLARGYGISIGFMIMSIYHLVEFFYNKKNIHLVLFNTAALMAILGNFTMLDFYLAALLTFNCVSYYQSRFVLKERFNLYKINKVNIILFLLMTVILYEPVRRVITYNQFDFGGSTGFMSDTMQALVSAIVSNASIGPAQALLVKALILLLLAVPLFILLIETLKHTTGFFEKNKPLIIVNLILIFIFIEIILQHFILKTDYLVGRFALFLFPLFILNLFFLLEYSLKFKFRYGILIVSVLVAAYSAFNFYQKADFYSCSEWGYDMETKNAVKALTAWHEQNATKHVDVKLGINWLFEPTVNFYRTTWHLSWLLPVDRKELTLESDYYYIFKEDLEKLKLQKFRELQSFTNTNTVLLKNDFNQGQE